ncbi:MAG: TetM/TetW/TetO/TetS family tetracycline resistance ribosomal protection protein [Eubacterium sp.]|nr:TetM/TetW/TetO/TetS family tetracycline resistance ribosomal protection protein [Eubacterium sp.]
MSTVSFGIFASVDAGKTTLSEAILYRAGVIKNTGRVDKGDAYLDTYDIEKKRGITVFSKQAHFFANNTRYVLVDTPGHVDFSPEAERVMSVLDYCVLVISAADGIQGHTRTLMRLLDEYGVPVFIFVNKMDQDGADKDTLMSELAREFSDACVELSDTESVAMLDEELLEKYLDDGAVTDEDKKRLIIERKLFPVFFGSALKNEGVEAFFDSFVRLTKSYLYGENVAGNTELTSDDFGARVYKISRDAKGTRLTHIRVTSGSLKPKQVIDEKVDQLRLYSGDSYELLDEACAGDICACTGLKNTYPGQGIGVEDDLEPPTIEPVLQYALVLPESEAVGTFLPKIKEIEEENPELHISFDEASSQIRVSVMGEVQTEVLHEIVLERFGVDIGFGTAEIVYRETPISGAEGIGHYEPLKHYAEAHIGIEPLPAGSGIVVESVAAEDDLALNWQRLIVTHILEKEHLGVRIGAPVTDVKFTVTGGKAHLKHTEGGDFRQATYRAIRQGLMKTGCRVLEPYYSFRISVPTEFVGRAMTDIEVMKGKFTLELGERAVLTGTAPVATMQDYPRTLISYTGGEGEISFEFFGYLPCHDEEELVEKCAYNPCNESDPPGSIFCSHGAGYYVDWDEVDEMAHVKTEWKPTIGADESGEDADNEWDIFPSGLIRRMDEALGVDEIDDILSQAGAKNRRAPKNSRRRAAMKTVRRAARPSGAAKPKKNKEKKGDYLLVDGYNVIYAWDSLRNLAADDIEQARGKLTDILCDYQGYAGCDVILVFDAYRVAGHQTETYDYHNIHVVFTKTAETADQYIEKFSVEKADAYNVTVVTSDGLEQIIIRGAGAHLFSAREFESEVKRRKEEAYERL